jgi:hypothetical protein
MLAPFVLACAAVLTQAPSEWRVTTPGFKLEPREGGGLRFQNDGGGTAAMGVMMRSVDAAPYRGKTVRLKARLWLEQPGAGYRAQLWLRVDRPGGTMGFFDNMQDRPIQSILPGQYEIVGDVAPDAERIAMGVLLGAAPAILIESITFEAAQDLPPLVREPARPLAPRGLENLRAFARLYGYVRFFHPSVEARATDWDAFAVAGVRAVEAAANSTDLAARLRKLFPATVLIAEGPVRKAEPPAGELVRWKHTGFGGGQPGIYRSELISADAPEVFTATLPGGIGVALPLATPQGEAAVKKSNARYTGDDRATRLGDVIIAWNILAHFYPYFDIVQVDWPAELDKALKQAAEDPDAAAFTVTLRRLMAALGDGHGNAMGPGGSGAPLALRLAWAEGRVVNGENGDAIVSIGGRPAGELLQEAETLISAATPQWKRWRALSTLGAGAGPAQVTVEPFGKPGERITLTVQRGRPPEEKRPAKLAELEPGVWYVDVTRCEDKDVDAALDQLAAAKGIVFDLRGYPRVTPRWLQHLSGKPLESAQWHVPVVTRPAAAMQFIRMPGWNLTPLAPLFKAKRAVMTDGRAISYAESTLGIIEHYKLAEIVGGPSAGTNGNVNPFSLPGGYGVVWTGMKVLKHDGSRHHGVGIQPTIPVAPTRAGLAAGRDEVLERAIAAVK